MYNITIMTNKGSPKQNIFVKIKDLSVAKIKFNKLVSSNQVVLEKRWSMKPKPHIINYSLAIRDSNQQIIKESYYKLEESFKWKRLGIYLNAVDSAKYISNNYSHSLGEILLIKNKIFINNMDMDCDIITCKCEDDSKRLYDYLLMNVQTKIMLFNGRATLKSIKWIMTNYSDVIWITPTEFWKKHTS